MLRRFVARFGLEPAARAAVRIGRSALRLALIVLRSRDVDLARRAVAVQKLSREIFGWATYHPTRLWEYPWVLREVQRRLSGRARTAVDFGAGKSPVPVGLTRLGLLCIVADPGVETDGRRPGGEWEWTDYARWGIETKRAGIEDAVVEPESLGFAVSVSVIEHVPADVRRQGVRQLAAALEPDGAAVLTVDLVDHTNHLSRWCLGQEVEPADEHGTVDDLIREAADAGLTLEKRAHCPLTGKRKGAGTRDGVISVEGLVFRKVGPSGAS